MDLLERCQATHCWYSKPNNCLTTVIEQKLKVVSVAIVGVSTLVGFKAAIEEPENIGVGIEIDAEKTADELWGGCSSLS